MKDFLEIAEPLDLVINAMVDNAPCDGRMFETYGVEFEYVRKHNYQYVFTLLDTDGRLFVQAGFQVVNAIGYFITRQAWTEVAFQHEAFTYEEDADE